MMKRPLIVSVLAAAVSLFTGLGMAADQESSQEKSQTQKQDREQIYGSQLMTQQERAEHLTKMRAARTAEEREQIRKEHHERMKARAKERGVALPDEPPARRGGMGPGGRMGPGGGSSR